MSDGAKCDYCDRPAVALAGETNGVLVCEVHAQSADYDAGCHRGYPYCNGRRRCACPCHDTPIPSEVIHEERDGVCIGCEHSGEPVEWLLAEARGHSDERPIPLEASDREEWRP